MTFGEIKKDCPWRVQYKESTISDECWPLHHHFFSSMRACMEGVCLISHMIKLKEKKGND